MAHMSQTVTHLSVMPHIITSNVGDETVMPHIFTNDITGSCLWHDSSISHDDTRDASHYINVWHISSLICDSYVSRVITLMCDTFRVICDSYVSRDITLMCDTFRVSCMTHMCHMTHSYESHDTPRRTSAAGGVGVAMAHCIYRMAKTHKIP